jgi:hypothetical protein
MAPLDQFHPEIAHVVDRVPDGLNCLDAAAFGDAHLVIVNLAVAS